MNKFSKAEIEYHLYNVKSAAKGEFAHIQTAHADAALKSLRLDSPTIHFLLITPTGDVTRVTFKKSAPMVYIPDITPLT